MRMGKVVTIRLNTKDCMSVLDLMKISDIDTVNMSYSSMVAVALASLMDNARKINLIPDRDGYEFMDMMGPYIDAPKNKNKLKVNERVQQHIREYGAPDINPHKYPDKSVPTIQESVKAVRDPETERAVTQWKDLEFKRARDKNNMTVEERLEWFRLFKMAFKYSATDYDWDNLVTADG